ncbi:MAG TPA: extracellular solute-binding protein [Longimicrobiales bacterium]|nr:extracellular solute-binding protein [Longimicrobiales bacterium]
MRRPVLLLALAGTVIATACGGPDRADPFTYDDIRPLDGPVSLNKEDYPVFPRPDEGADPSVPAELGGAGFTGEGWETNLDFDFIGDPRALKGGLLRDAISTFPGTLRIEGPESNTAFNYAMQSLVYESLLSLHPTTLEYIPALATHWQISDDGMTFRFRIDPNARFSDGTPVTAEDVVATWDFLMDPGLQAPANELTFGKFERPVAESRYIVRVQAKDLNWRNFLYFSGMAILPAHILAEVDGARYLQEYNFKLLPGSGPYTLEESDINRGNSITLRKRNDYWAADYRRNVGLYNFSELRYSVVRDRNLEFEMFKRGDLDYYLVNRAQMWAEELDFDRVQQGLIQKRMIYNHSPNGIQGIAFNTRRAPFDDIRVRKALFHLFNRELMVETLMYGAYELQHSYYAGSVYENPDNPRVLYNPEEALRLLTEAGYERNAQGRLVRNGQPLDLELIYSDQTAERYLTVYQEDLRRVGINLNLRLVTPETLFRLVMERQFGMVTLAWGGLLFPNPETSFHSSLADPNNTNNITGFKSARLDELAAAYDVMFDVEDRVAAIREIDGILASEFHYILEWYAPYQRIVYWNKFGHPESYISRVGDYSDIASMWWIDPGKADQARRGMGDPSVRMEVGETEVRYWLDYARAEEQTAAR